MERRWNASLPSRRWQTAAHAPFAESNRLIRNVLRGELEQHAARVDLDKLSLQKFYETNPTFKRIDTKIAEFFTGPVMPDPANEHDLQRLRLCGIETIDELMESLEKREGMILEFAKDWASEPDSSPFKYVREGVCLLYLFYVCLAEVGDRAAIAGALSQTILNFRSPEHGADRILNTYSKIKNAR